MFRRTARALLARADIAPRENAFRNCRPWDPAIKDSRTYRRALLSGTLGLGEAYMDGWWDAEDLPEFFRRALRAGLDRSVRFNAASAGLRILAALANLQSQARAYIVGEKHYDIGNDLYEAMLDPSMSYSCAYWKDAPDLAAAQQAKLRLIGEKLKLRPGMRVLEIGCGWGGLAAFLAKEYGVTVVGLTISKEQEALARKRCAGLPVEIRYEDYRQMPASYAGSFDRAVSVGMFEHVGPKNYRDYFRFVRRMLTRDGLFLLHTIGGDGNPPEPWLNRYIFPNGVLPSESQIEHAYRGAFVMEDWHNFGPDYAQTLAAWRKNFLRAYPALRAANPAYDARFYRMWVYYLALCEGTFRARKTQLWQIVLSAERDDAYRSVR